MEVEVASVVVEEATATEKIIVEAVAVAAVEEIGTRKAGVVTPDTVEEVVGDQVDLELKVSHMVAEESHSIVREVVIVELVVVAVVEEEDLLIKILVSLREDLLPAHTVPLSLNILILSQPMELRRSKFTRLVTKLGSISAI